MPTGYLDTNLIIGVAKGDLDVTEMAALAGILERRKRGEIVLCTSRVAKEELDRHAQSGTGRTEHLIYLLLDDVPAVLDQFVIPAQLGNSSQGGGLTGGVLVKDFLLGKLEQILPHEDDCRHIFQAAHNGMDYFVTDDRKSILQYAEAVEQIVPLKLRSPSQLATELATAAS